jgi:hypothetical protein
LPDAVFVKMNRAGSVPGKMPRPAWNQPEILKPELSKVWELLDTKRGEV